MPVAADDVRTFESVIQDTPEDVEDAKSNLDYFRENGLQTDQGGDQSEEPLAEKVEKVEKVEQKVAKPAVVEEADETDGEEPVHESQQSTHDEEKRDKLGWRAKKTKQIKELQEKILTTEAKKDGEIAELRRQLEGKGKSDSPTSTGAASSGMSAAPPAAAKVESKPAASTPAAVDTPKAKEFDKPRPARPEFKNFVNESDPVAAHQDALAEFSEKLSDWKDEKREFDSEQKVKVQEQIKQETHARTIQEERATEIREKLEKARSTHSDWDATTKGKFNPVLDYVLSEAIPDGLEIAYQLARPENAEVLASLKKSSQHADGESQRSIERRISQAIFDISQQYGKLKLTPAAAPVEELEDDDPELDDESEGDEEEVVTTPSTPPAAATKKSPVASATKPVVKTQTQTSSKPETPQRRAEAAPAPVRSRGAAALRLEDIPVEDYDARRKWRAAHGEL